MKKDTGKLVEELHLCPDFHTFYHENEDYMVDSTLTDLLTQLMKSKELRKSEVIRMSELSEVYAYQIFSGLRIPDRRKLLCLVLAMDPSLDEVQQVLKCAGYPPLYVKLPFDSIIIYGLYHHLSVLQINRLLFEYDLEMLG